MQDNKVQILHCKCGLLYMSNPRDSIHVIRCPACGRTPQSEHLDQSIPSNFTQYLSSVLREYVVPGTLTIVGVIGLVIVLPRSLSQQVPPPVVSMLSQPTVEPSPTRSPISLPNGTNLIPPQDWQGHGNLRVDNGTSRDAVVKLVDRDSGDTLHFVYVQANHEVTIKNIRPCNCTFKFSMGRDWDQQTSKFLQNASFSKFTEPLNFEEIQAEDGVRWRGYKVTLHSVPTGNARTTPIRESDFENN